MLMSKEVVCLIGNGFDLALGLRTSYTDFRNFIEVKYGSGMSENLIYKALSNRVHLIELYGILEISIQKYMGKIERQ